MGYVSHLEGRDDDSLENLTRCGEIIAEHPGLCRYNTWYVGLGKCSTTGPGRGQHSGDGEENVPSESSWCSDMLSF